MDFFDQQTMIVLGEIVLSMFLGGLIGFEREVSEKPAGLRTHMLVAGAATLLVSLGAQITASYLSIFSPDVITVDPVRVIQAIIVGISFLGAGTIVLRKEQEQIEGLTTAAAVLFTAGIGIAVALGLWAISIGSTLIILIVVWLIGKIEVRIWGENAKRDQ